MNIRRQLEESSGVVGAIVVIVIAVILVLLICGIVLMFYGAIFGALAAGAYLAFKGFVWLFSLLVAL